MQYADLVGERDDAADAARNHHRYARAVFRRDGQSRVLDGFEGCDRAQLHEPVHAAGFFSAYDGCGVEVLDLGCDGGLVAFGVEGRDWRDAGLAGD